jgi:hypothetical protein
LNLNVKNATISLNNCFCLQIAIFRNVPSAGQKMPGNLSLPEVSGPTEFPQAQEGSSLRHAVAHLQAADGHKASSGRGAIHRLRAKKAEGNYKQATEIKL